MSLETTIRKIGERMAVAWSNTHKKKQNTHICPIKKYHRLTIRQSVDNFPCQRITKNKNKKKYHTHFGMYPQLGVQPVISLGNKPRDTTVEGNHTWFTHTLPDDTCSICHISTPKEWQVQHKIFSLIPKYITYSFSLFIHNQESQ